MLNLAENLPASKKVAVQVAERPFTRRKKILAYTNLAENLMEKLSCEHSFTNVCFSVEKLCSLRSAPVANFH